MIKTHARDYLSMFSRGKPEWVKTLIREAIETNGSISNDRQSEIFDNLIRGVPLRDQRVQLSSEIQVAGPLLIESLTHVGGVSALRKNQIINFSPSVTVLYGLNGSGKSSYFKILNNISGGIYKEIKPNIYEDGEEKKRLNVSICYKVGDVTNQYEWQDSSTALPEFRGVKVFDSSYLNGLLQTKSPDETLVYPLGLHLFGYIAKILDSFTHKLNCLRDEEIKKLPRINTGAFTEPIKSKFDNCENISSLERTKITEKFSFSDDENIVLDQKESDLLQLKQNNPSDAIVLLTKKNAEISAFQAKVLSITTGLKRYGEVLRESLKAYANAKLVNDDARRRSEILTHLPKSSTQEWKSFITAGQNYSLKLEKEIPEKCPYCRQELKSSDAIKIVTAYADFLSDTSEKNLNDAIKSLENIRTQIERFDVTIELTDEIKNIMKNTDDVVVKLRQLSDYKASLKSAKTADEIPTLAINFSNEQIILTGKLEENKIRINALNASKAEKEQRAAELQKELTRLRERKSLSEQQAEIEKYFSVFDKKEIIENKKSETRTNQLTQLANQAQRELLTETLTKNFERELQALGRNDLRVQLEVVNGSKGKCSTQLKLAGNNPLKDILSEGEQKAVGLAMFFAEIQNEDFPIILDDPTTSLDHMIASKLARRLLSFKNQIIVFTHHQLFLNAFSNTHFGHFCDKYGRSTCGKSSKHVFVYEVGESINEKGVIDEYSNRNSKTYIDLIKNEIQQITTNNLKDVPKNIRKCIECLIDEKILKNQLLRKYSHGEGIAWEKLKEISTSNASVVAKLKEIHGRVSGGELHLTREAEENSPTPRELQDFLESLMSIEQGTFLTTEEKR